MYCTKCGSENSDDSKFCSNCGNNLEQTSSGVFSGESAEPVYEKITDAEEVKPEAIPSYQEEIKINYGPEESATDKRNDSADGNANVYSTASQTQYYSTDLNETKQGGGNIGFAIASLVCGILSLVCCCLSLFSGVLAIAAVVLGIITLCFKYDGKGMAIAGIVTGGIGFLFVIFAFLAGSSAAYQEILNDAVRDLY